MSDPRSQAYWEALLQDEGLGVIEVDTDKRDRQGLDKLGKLARLDAKINDVNPAGYITGKHVTADATETRVTLASYVAEDVLHGEGDMLEALALSVLATSKESELAALARKHLRLDDFGRSAIGARRRKLSATQKAENIRAKRAGKPLPHDPNPYASERIDYDALQYAIDRCDYFLGGRVTDAYASKDAGNGPLSYVGPIKADKVKDSAIAEVKASPVVDTLGYLPGRSPFQRARFAATNSDITG